MDADKAAHTDGVLTALGMPASSRIGTPTTIVGTQIIRGAEVDGILKVIETQKNWGGTK